VVIIRRNNSFLSSLRDILIYSLLVHGPVLHTVNILVYEVVSHLKAVKKIMKFRMSKIISAHSLNTLNASVHILRICEYYVHGE
jgi:hypothetical protein